MCYTDMWVQFECRLNFRFSESVRILAVEDGTTFRQFRLLRINGVRVSDYVSIHSYLLNFDLSSTPIVSPVLLYDN